MTGSDYLGRWIDLVAHLLTQPESHDPLLEICAELSERFSSTAAGTVDYSDQRARLGVYRFAGSDAARYAPVIGDHPLALHYRATGDSHARSLDDARRFARDPWAGALLDRLREDGVRDSVFLPLRPRSLMDHRWLGIASDRPLGAPARDELERVGPLIRAIDVQYRVVAATTTPSARGGHCAGLSARELSVLGLVSRGLTATAIATTLQISVRTVSKHQQNIYRKLDVSDRLSAVVRAQELGMLSRPRPSEVSVATIESAVVHRPRSLIG